ncbi:MAG: rare lipoprotein [Planctomycetota bacterium]|nr:rare lipoprotein [Planctomycetota bacterium]
MYPYLKTRGFLVLFIVLICVIGCANTNVRKNDIKSTDIKKTDTKDPGNKQSNLYHETGIASFISDEYDGKMTASGVRYDRNKMTSAHPSLPFGTKILITNLGNNRKVEVIVVDRFHRTTDRIANVSYRAGLDLDLIESGIAKVGITIIEKPGQSFN